MLLIATDSSPLFSEEDKMSDTFMPPQVRALMTLLTGSSLCCSDVGGGGGDGVHHIRVTHPSGEETNFSVSTKWEPDVSTKQFWGKFKREKLSVDVMNFPQLRKEAGRVLKYFIRDPVPYVTESSVVSQPPAFWRVFVPVNSLPRSKTACYQALGKCGHIRLESIVPWSIMRPVREKPHSDVLKSTKSPHKALLMVIIEVANFLSCHHQEVIEDGELLVGLDQGVDGRDANERVSGSVECLIPKYDDAYHPILG